MIKYIPNFLSALRIVLSFFLFFAIRRSHLGYACWIIGICGITDFLDGYLARRLNQISALGGLLDPLADKMFFFALFTGLLMQGRLSFWVFLVFILRDVILLTGTAFIKTNGVIYEFTPTLISKINTTLQFLFGMIALIWPDSPFLFVLLGIILVTTVISGLLYIIRFLTTVTGNNLAGLGTK